MPSIPAPAFHVKSSLVNTMIGCVVPEKWESTSQRGETKWYYTRHLTIKLGRVKVSGQKPACILTSRKIATGAQVSTVVDMG